ncbi:MAG: response regulator [Bacteroidales bacterium]
MIIFAITGHTIPVVAFAVVLISLMLLQIARMARREKKREEEFSEMKKLVEKKDTMIADFSHKIRTPLNNFSIIIELLLDSKPDKTQKELLETLIASTSNMVTAVNEMTLDSAKEISFETRKNINFNLASTLQNTVDLFVLKSGSSHRMEIIPGDEKLTLFRGDPIAVKQIFLDIFNTIELSDRAGSCLAISFSSRQMEKERIIVDFSIVSDRPIRLIGLNSDQPEASDSLAVKLILSLGGVIEESVGSGSELRFSLPLLTPVEEIRMSDAARRIQKIKSEKKEIKSLSDANILLVEDNPTNQKIVMISIASKVKSIDTATNGKEALDMFGKSNYDLILMDVQLPVMDGITAVQKIRELEASTSKHTPIIAITANAMLGDKEKCLSAGMDEYLSKPFHPSQLISMIEKLLSD